MATSLTASTTPDFPRLEVRAKFFFEGERKFFLQGATYGPFRPRREGDPHFPLESESERDFQLMCEMGINVVRVYHTPPRWFMDLAARHRVRIMITIPWHKRVLFLDDPEALQTIRGNVQKAAETHIGHPALMGFFVDNEIPPDLVRWYGAKKMVRFVDSLVATVKKSDPGALVAYANFPPTEYLLPQNVDFYSYNVYLEREKDLVNYLGRLQNLSGDKPLILSEFGLDTIRKGEEAQANLLCQHVKNVFQSGLAGTIFFSWTDEWFTDGVDVEDWAFGIVTKDRRPKKSYEALKPYLANPMRPLAERFPLDQFPKVSIVVCSYNGARTLSDCMRSLHKIHYPNYEVVFVDDGSKDETQEIMKEFPWARNIVQENKGLSVARNVGIEASEGEIIAFTDSDCMVDQDWLYFLVHSLQQGNFAATGGPNISPPATDWIQAAVASSPGSPSHILVADNIAEHVPGCNMAYYKWALLEIGGFDPEYRKAGDDVDVCWRIMQRGYLIGFAPTAVVWHYRRFTVKAYYSQQRGYGEAEALLRYKHLQYFGLTGSAIWKGTIYSQVHLDPLFTKPVIYHGIFGTGFFQSIYSRPESLWVYLLGSFEWMVLTLFTFFLSIPLTEIRLIPLIMFGLNLMVALSYMVRVRIEPKHDTFISRLLVLRLALTQPWVRAWARYFTWLREKRTPLSVVRSKEEAPHASTSFWKAGHLSFWSEGGKERGDLLHETVQLLESEGWNYGLDTGWKDWDIHVFVSRWWNLRLRTMTEIYPHGRRLTRVGNYLHLSTLTILALLVFFTFGLVFILTSPGYAPYVLGTWGLFIFGGVLQGLRLRFRLAELVQVAAIRSGLQSVGAGQKSK